jgi:hypothetical protein
VPSPFWTIADRRITECSRKISIALFLRETFGKELVELPHRPLKLAGKNVGIAMDRDRGGIGLKDRLLDGRLID